MRPTPRFLVRIAFSAACIAAMGSPAWGAGVKAVQIGTFVGPVYAAVAPGYGRYLFVVELPGQIQILQDEVKLGQPFLDIRSITRGQPDPGAGGEQGLLSVAFAPDYKTSRKFYVAFTNNNGDIEIDEFLRSAANAARADKMTRRRLLTIPHRNGSNHNGGQLQFGPDGFLYLSTGDGGGTPEAARNLNSLLGKILRIDPRPTGSSAYRIPPDNPFVGRAGRDEIYVYGLRNPWRFSFDGQRIAIADVGQSRFEEVNFLAVRAAAGVNFGWPQYEGKVIYDNSQPGPHPPKFPMFTYSHNSGGCAVIGGYVLRDPSVPDMTGRYLYGDACTGKVRSFLPDVGSQKAIDDKATGITLPGLSGFGRGFAGQLYATQTSGALSRIEPR